MRATTFNTRTAITLLFVLGVLALNILIISDMSPVPTTATKGQGQGQGERDAGYVELRPLVALLTTVTATTPRRNTSTLPLFTTMLPSLLDTLDCEYRYLVVVGHKRGEVYYDSEQVHYAVLF